jgi:serine protease Do
MNTQPKNSTVSIHGAPRASRRGLFVNSALAGAVVLALAGAQLAYPVDARAIAAGTRTPAGTATTGPVGFADIAERVTPAVVNVSVTGRTVGARAKMPDLPEGLPFNELFKRFFEERGITPHGFGMPGHIVQGLGSGFIIDPDGLVVTNYHVIDGASEVRVTLNDGSTYPAKVRGVDSKTDLALLQIDAHKPLPFVQFGDSDAVRVGDWVLTVGNQLGLPDSVTAGIISARGRDIHSGPYDDYLQIDAPINRGNSGGPLFDTSGHVVGVNTAIYSPSGGNVGIGFAIPAATASKIVAQLRANGHIERGWLGVQIQPVTQEVAESLGLGSDHGALVATVVADSPAAKAGIRAGDVILRAGGKEVEDFRELSRIIAGIPVGTKLKIEVSRAGSREELPVFIGAMPDEQKLATVDQGGSPSSSPRLGLRLAPMTSEAKEALGLDPASRGVIVAEVESGSPAERAGIEPGSIISMVGQRAVDTPDELVEAVHTAIARHPPALLLRVEQGGQIRFVGVRLTA